MNDHGPSRWTNLGIRINQGLRACGWVWFDLEQRKTNRTGCPKQGCAVLLSTHGPKLGSVTKHLCVFMLHLFL